jgi:hypothetical protein
MSSRPYGRSPKQGAVIAGLLFLGLISLGGVTPEYGLLYLVWAAGCLVFGLAMSVPVYVRARRAERVRAVTPELAEVRLTRWCRSAEGHVREARLGSARAFTLRLVRHRGVLERPGEGAVLSFDRWGKAPGALAHALRQGAIVGRLGTATPVSVTRGETIVVRCADGPGLLVGRRDLVIAGRTVAMRDILGWRVRTDASEEEAALCALVLLSSLPDVS